MMSFPLSRSMSCLSSQSCIFPPQQYVLPSDYLQHAQGSDDVVRPNASDVSSAEAKLVATEHIEDLD
jgi:hypothetical protein